MKQALKHTLAGIGACLILMAIAVGFNNCSPVQFSSGGGLGSKNGGCVGADCPPVCTGPNCPPPTCTGPNCPPPTCTGPSCPPVCTGSNCPPPCTGPSCPPPCTGPNCPPPPTTRVLPSRFVAPSADVVFMIDNSPSMANQLASLGSNFMGFIDQLNAGDTDWRVCAMTTDYMALSDPNSPTSTMRTFSNGRMYLQRSDSDLNNRFHQMLSTDPNGGDELGIAALHTLLKYGTRGENCLRPGVEKHVIFISDEDENNDGTISGSDGRILLPKSDPEAIPGLMTSERLTVHTIAILDNQCLEAQRAEAPNAGSREAWAQPGRLIARLADLTSGRALDVCSSNYSQHFTAIGARIGELTIENPCGSRSITVNRAEGQTDGGARALLNAAASNGRLRLSHASGDSNVALSSIARVTLEYTCN